jgi:predicted RNA-binding protein associated with RNAse of E/G family
VVRDGSSYEKAIIVNSISEEYVYVRKDCKGCQMKGQSLNFNDKKPYDILTLIKPNGDEVSYYFDISSFFGK